MPLEPQKAAAKFSTYDIHFIVAHLDKIERGAKKLLLNTQNYADSPEQMEPNNMNTNNLNTNN